MRTLCMVHIHVDVRTWRDDYAYNVFNVILRVYTLYNSKIRDRDSTIDELDYGQTIHANIHHEAEKGTTFLF